MSGLKSIIVKPVIDVVRVSPYIGEWIEIKNLHDKVANRLVSPYIGEWIEITNLKKKLEGK